MFYYLQPSAYAVRLYVVCGFACPLPYAYPQKRPRENVYDEPLNDPFGSDCAPPQGIGGKRFPIQEGGLDASEAVVQIRQLRAVARLLTGQAELALLDLDALPLGDPEFDASLPMAAFNRQVDLC